MKELLTTGMIVSALTLFGTPTGVPVCESNYSEPVKSGVLEGFLPHERVTTLPIQEEIQTEEMLPDFGSSAYL